MTEWQPIETAPKDGSPVLLFGSRLGWDAQPSRVCGFFNGRQWWIYGACDGEPKAKTLRRGSTQQLDTINPTLWMEIPNRPEETTSNQSKES